MEEIREAWNEMTTSDRVKAVAASVVLFGGILATAVLMSIFA